MGPIDSNDPNLSKQPPSQRNIIEFLTPSPPAWQKPPQKMRKLISPEGKSERPQSKVHQATTRTKNRFSALSQLSQNSSSVTANVSTSTSNNPGSNPVSTATQDNNIIDTTKSTNPNDAANSTPIFVQDVKSYIDMIQDIAKVIPSDGFSATTLRNETIKILPKTVGFHRTLTKYFQANNMRHYTYQLKQDRAFKVVLRGLHSSVAEADIKEAIEEQGFTVRSVSIIRHHRTKEPLPLFFANLEPVSGVKIIYDTQYLLHTKVKFESPKPRFDPVQCRRCQMYGHTKVLLHQATSLRQMWRRP